MTEYPNAGGLKKWQPGDPEMPMEPTEGFCTCGCSLDPIEEEAEARVNAQCFKCCRIWLMFMSGELWRIDNELLARGSGPADPRLARVE